MPHTGSTVWENVTQDRDWSLLDLTQKLSKNSNQQWIKISKK